MIAKATYLFLLLIVVATSLQGQIAYYDHSSKKYGVINEFGKIIIRAKYDDKMSFENGFAPISKDGKWGLIDVNGKIIIPLQYEKIGNYGSDLVPASENGQWGYINLENKRIIDFKYDAGYPFYNGIATIEEGEIKRFINVKGSFITPLIFQDAVTIDNLQYGKSSDKWYKIQLSSVVKLRGEPSSEENILTAYKGYVTSYSRTDKDRYGYKDNTGEVVILPIYRSASQFSEGLAAVEERQGEGFGYIDGKGEYIIKPKYKYALNFQSGIAPVLENDSMGFGFINTKGEYVIKPNAAWIWVETQTPCFINGLCIIKTTDVKKRDEHAVEVAEAFRNLNAKKISLEEYGRIVEKRFQFEKIIYINIKGEVIFESKYFNYYYDESG